MAKDESPKDMSKKDPIAEGFDTAEQAGVPYIPDVGARALLESFRSDGPLLDETTKDRIFEKATGEQREHDPDDNTPEEIPPIVDEAS
jgi:hypothetical protein